MRCEVVRVGGNGGVAAPLRRQPVGASRSQRDPDVRGQPRDGPARGAGALADPLGRLPRVLGREPVEQHAVGHLAGEPAHPGPEGGDVEPRSEMLTKGADAVPDAGQRRRVRAPHAQQKAIQGQRVRTGGPDDGIRRAGVEGHHADAERDAGGLGDRRGEGGQPVDRARIVHPEGPVAERLRGSRRLTDHVRRHPRMEGESTRHHIPP